MRTRTNDQLEGPTRTCILTREAAPKARLVRIALGPDGSVAPDVRAKAPSRGAYIGVGKEALDFAQAKGRLKAALSRAFKTNAVTVPENFSALVEAALERNALDRLGMEARAGTLISGSEKVETAARTGKVRLLVHAQDAGEDGRKRLDQAWRAGGGEPRGLVFPASRSILSAALGRGNVVHLALIEAGAARRVREALARWQAFLEPDATLEGHEPAAGTASEDDEGLE